MKRKTVTEELQSVNNSALNQNCPLMLSAAETARMLGLSRTKIYEMIANGELPVVRWGRSVRVHRTKLLELIEGRTSTAA